jgi:hypothetical protein
MYIWICTITHSTILLIIDKLTVKKLEQNRPKVIYNVHRRKYCRISILLSNVPSLGTGAGVSGQTIQISNL